MRNALTLLMLAALTLGAYKYGDRPHNVSGLDIAAGRIPGATVVHKFGINLDIDNAPEDVWLCADTASAYIKTYASDSTIYVSSDDEDDAGKTVNVYGLDESGIEQTVTGTLGSAVASGTAAAQVGDASGWDRIYRVHTTGSTETEGTVYIGTDSDVGSDGVPDATTQILSCTSADSQQTLLSHFTIPANKTGYMTIYCAGTSPVSATAEQARIQLLTRESGGVWRDRHDIRVISTGNGNYCREFPVPVKLAALTDIRVHVLSTASNNTGVWANYDIVLEE